MVSVNKIFRKTSLDLGDPEANDGRFDESYGESL